MIVMEGLLMLPPDRNAIIGRAAWKVCTPFREPRETRSDLLADSICSVWHRITIEDADWSACTSRFSSYVGAQGSLEINILETESGGCHTGCRAQSLHIHLQGEGTQVFYTNWRKLSNCIRVTGNSLRSIIYLPSSPARYGMSNTGSNLPLYPPCCSNSSLMLQTKRQGSGGRVELVGLHRKIHGRARCCFERYQRSASISTIGRLQWSLNWHPSLRKH